MELSLVGLGAAAVMGFVFGAGPCTVTCLPYLGPVFLGRDGGWRDSMGVVVPFSFGRLAGYTTLGTVAGYAGQAATSWFEEGPAGVVLGVAAVVLGTMMLRRRAKSGHCAARRPAEQMIAMPGTTPPQRRLLPVSLFGLGMGMALNPCIPLASVLAMAAASGDPVTGAALGLAFGMGAVVVPAVAFALVVAHFGRQVREALRPWLGRLESGAGGLLIVLGTLTALGWIQP